ncbi:MAG: hypothetical protein ACRERV_04105 [Methylococcales bacterium]
MLTACKQFKLWWDAKGFSGRVAAIGGMIQLGRKLNLNVVTEGSNVRRSMTF